MLITNVININANIVKKIGVNFWVPESGLPSFGGFLVVCNVFGVTVDFGVLTFPESLLWVSDELVGVGLGFSSPSVELEVGGFPPSSVDDFVFPESFDDVGDTAVVDDESDPSTSIRVTARMAIIANIFRDVMTQA